MVPKQNKIMREAWQPVSDLTAKAGSLGLTTSTWSMERTVETGSGMRILISQNLPPVTFFLSRAAFSKLFQMVPTTEKYCFSDFEAYMIAFCYMNQFMMKKKLCREAFRSISIWVTGKNAYTRIIFMRENDCLMIYFNFYFVMSVCLWRYALFDGSKEG